MSYAAAAALQAAIYQRLVLALPGIGVFDEVPSTASGTFVLIGPEDARDQSDKSGAGAEHVLTISVISDSAGFQAAKEIASVVSDDLGGPVPVLSRGRLVSLLFQRAIARRIDEGDVRRIDMTFRARLEL